MHITHIHGHTHGRTWGGAGEERKLTACMDTELSETAVGGPFIHDGHVSLCLQLVTYCNDPNIGGIETSIKNMLQADPNFGNFSF